MRYLALACDYDGTLAHHGRVSDSTVDALEKLRGSGRRLLLVTGRELDDLQNTFARLDLFESIVAENGALLYRPGARQEEVLVEPPTPDFPRLLRERGVGPMSVGRVIVATWKPFETTVLETIRDLGLDLQVIFNKDAVMVLPAGVNKATGLASALKELGLSPHEVVGVGDAENDLAFLAACECGVAVQNALPAVKERADMVTAGDHGTGVEELIRHLLDNDLGDVEARLSRHHLLLGTRQDGTEEKLPVHGIEVLIAGPSGSGKSTAAHALLERLQERHYQFCIVDPEGDYEGLEGAVTLGDGKRAPSIAEVLQLLDKPEHNAVVNLVGLRLADRPPFFLSLLSRLQEMRSRVGRPHWIVVDEAHHLLPTAWQPAAGALHGHAGNMLFVTVHADQVSAAVLRGVSSVLAVGAEPQETLRQFCEAIGTQTPRANAGADASSIVVWHRHADATPQAVTLTLPRLEHHRHVRKYAEGELPPEKSFYFRGPDNKLNLRAQNLILFNQIAEGVDDATWNFHLRRGDYSRWLREKIGDPQLAAEAAKIEAAHAPPTEARAALRAAIEHFYTLPTSAPLPMPGTDAAAQSKSGQSGS